MENQKLLHELELFETSNHPYSGEFIRVPGGWIFRSWNQETQLLESPIFIPYSDEFKPFYDLPMKEQERQIGNPIVTGKLINSPE